MLARATQQTTRVNGKRVVIRTSAKGRVTVTDALPEEWELQAAQVTRLHGLPEFGKRFVLAGDMNAERRGPFARAKAMATGMTAGEPDLRIYGEHGRLLLIENKVGKGRLSPDQVKRHEALQRLGYRVEVVRAVTCHEAADNAQTLVLDWLADGAIRLAA